MKRSSDRFRSGTEIALLLSMSMVASVAYAQQGGSAPGRTIATDKARVVQHWSAERRALAQPRDLVIDARGLGYLRNRDGSLAPYGHKVAAQAGGNGGPTAGPSGGDSTPPTITNMNPTEGAVIGAAQTFSATVTDAGSGVRSVSFVIRYPNGTTTQSFSAARGANDVWSVNLQGFSDGDWAWWVEARDAASGRGNRSTSKVANFAVDTGGGGSENNQSTGDGTVSNAEWTAGGAVQMAAGRIYFEMPGNAKRKGPWTGYVCSGTVIADQASGRSIILTAAHCVYDDANKAFARNVLFIPNQAGTSGSGTDLDCNNDPLGCWVPSFGVVDGNWTSRIFPNNIAWDYAYYVVSDSGAHAGAPSSSASLESAAGALTASFDAPLYDTGTDHLDRTHALGYSYSEDPKFMYCTEDMTTEGAVNWWLPSCGLSGGSSGGPWVQSMDTTSGRGEVISVNSWGYSNPPGMAGPKLVDTTAWCVFLAAQTVQWNEVSAADGEAGYSYSGSCP